MTIKNILAAYSSEDAHGSGVKHAIKLAQHHDAWLTGIMRHGRHALEQRFLAEIRDMIADQLREADAKRVQDVSDRFLQMVKEAGLQDRSEFVDLDPDNDGPLSDYARNFDLVVTGVHSHDIGEAHLSANPDLIALRSGRPVIVVPNDYESEGLAEHALVAWDGKRSSARALGDAMSILEEKPKVTITTVGTKPTADKELLMRNLKRHGIDATYRVDHRRGSIAQTILRVADEVSAELVVMGAFEHSKFAHTLMGGVSTGVIAQANVPVFLSH